MIRELKLKPDFAKTIERFEAWWHCEIIDRPPVSVSVKPTRQAKMPKSTHRTMRERWMDVEFVVDKAIAWMESRDYLGDSFPIYYPNLGPEVSATVFGCELEFGEATSWSKPVVHDPSEWERFIKTPPNFQNIYWQTIERMADYAIARSEGRYVVGITDLHGDIGIVAAAREPQTLCEDLMDCPELVAKAIPHAANAFVECFRRQYAKVSAAGFGSTTWMSMYHQGPAYVPSCDFWCMVSHEIARDMILPHIVTEMGPLERSIFHLDGPQALRHLDLVLALPNLNGVQWVYGDGNGPASRWIDVYRRCQAAGKCIQVYTDTADDALTVLRALRPEGVWLSVGNPFASAAEANAFLKEVERISAERRTKA
jgi:hypothetical protein